MVGLFMWQEKRSHVGQNVETLTELKLSKNGWLVIIVRWTLNAEPMLFLVGDGKDFT
jgi:hypothetical protein